MRIHGQPRNQEKTQLYLVQETSQELTFQLGSDIPKLSIKKAWTSLIINLIIGVLSSGFTIVAVSSFISTKRSIPIPDSDLYPFHLFSVVFVIATIAMFYNGLYSPCVTFWTFDLLRQQIIKNETNLLGKTHSQTFFFDEVKSIQVQEEHDYYPDTRAELYLELKSGKRIAISVSSYKWKKNEKAEDLKYHQILAEKIRYYMGL